MGETRHTPGPWLIGRDPRPGMEWNNHIEGRGGFDVCFMSHDGTPENVRGEANAQLIVAAPDMLEALRSISTLLDQVPVTQRTGDYVDDAQSIARAAIAKATNMEAADAR